MSPLLVTIVGGVVVVMIGLLIEYGIIKRRKQNGSPAMDTTAHNTGSTIAALGNTASTPLNRVELPWPDAINKALDSFQTLHEGKDIEVISTKVDMRSARLFVVVLGPRRAFNKNYSLTVNKTGELVTIEQTR